MSEFHPKYLEKGDQKMKSERVVCWPLTVAWFAQQGSAMQTHFDYSRFLRARQVWMIRERLWFSSDAKRGAGDA